MRKGICKGDKLSKKWEVTRRVLWMWYCLKGSGEEEDDEEELPGASERYIILQIYLKDLFYFFPD